jgi:GntR family transcriptional regulator
MIFQVHAKSGKPVYLQLVDQVRFAAASGALRPGDPLPSIRSLAKTLRVNRNTVAKACAELENLGVIQTIVGKGCFLKETDSPLTRQVRHKLLADRIDEAVVTARQMQVGPETLRSLLEERIQFFSHEQAALRPATKEKKQTKTPASPPPPTIPGDKENWTPLTD